MLAHDVLAKPGWPGVPPGPAAQCRAARGTPGVRDVGGSDGLLAVRLAAGDDHALTEIFDRLAPAVYGTAVRILGNAAAAQDVVQEVFVQLWSHPDRYDPAAGSLRSYLSMRARHRAVDMLRSDLRRAARQERSHWLAGQQPIPSACEEAIAAEAADVVRDAVRTLPEGQRQVVELTYFAGLTCREVARTVGIPEGTAKSRLRLALARLAAALDRQLLESS